MPAANFTRIALADDHEVVRLGLRSLFEDQEGFEVVGDAATGIDALRLVERLTPDVLIADLRMPGMGGFELIRHVVRNHRETRVVVLSMYSDESSVLAALRSGAMAYVLKESDFEKLLEAVRSALAGRRYLCPRLSRLGVDTLPGDGDLPDPYDALTARERQVLHLSAEGASAAEIAKHLFISRRTVETHRANLMRKLHLANQSELVRYAIRRGLLS